MQSREKPKLTVETSVRLIVKVSGELMPLPEDLQVEPGLLPVRVWKPNPIWKVEMAAGPDPQFTFENTNPNSRDVVWYDDGQAVVTEFLNLKSPEDALAFFQKYNFDETKKADEDQKIRIRWREIKSIQETFLSVLANEPVPQNLQEFVFQPLQVQLQHEVKVVQVISKKPVKKEEFDAVVGIAVCKDVLSSMRAVTFLSRGSVWRRCGNPRCEMWFKPSRPDQRCHDAACTRRAIANRFNERTRKAKRKRRRK
jgi:hypothetical protein